jgi:protein-tyrosine phosphatase
MAELLLRDRLAARGVDAVVASAGRVGAGMYASAEIQDLLAAQGLDGSGHRSRVLAADEVVAADLVLGMAREHVREAVLLAPEVLPRAFTLKELARRGRAVGPRPAAEPLREWLARAAADRRRADIMGDAEEDDIVDPIGMSADVYRRVGAEIGRCVDAVVDLAWPPGARVG